MEQDEIIRIAREAGLVEPYHPYNPWSASQEGIEHFYKLAFEAGAKQEREACAKLAENWDFNVQGLVKAIRARGETK